MINPGDVEKSQSFTRNFLSLAHRPCSELLYSALTLSLQQPSLSASYESGQWTRQNSSYVDLSLEINATATFQLWLAQDLQHLTAQRQLRTQMDIHPQLLALLILAGQVLCVQAQVADQEQVQ